MEKKQKELHRLISLTFDEKPAERKNAALKLAESDDPAAIFALLELSYDKVESVKKVAREILSKKRTNDKDAISFADIFNQPVESEESAEPSVAEDTKKKKILYPVEQIFEKKLGKTKAAIMKNRMMPTIEKIYLKAIGSEPDKTQQREESMQKLLTSYIDVLSELDELGFEEEKIGKIQTIEKTVPEQKNKESVALEEVGTYINDAKISKELATLIETEEKTSEETVERTKDTLEHGENRSIFRKAYDIMMASKGDEKIMFQESKKLKKQLTEEVDLAFKMAKQHFKSENITTLSELKDGMRNINTDILHVVSIENGEYSRTKTKKDTYTRVVINDEEGGEGILYLFESRGRNLKPGAQIKIIKGRAKTFSFSGETAITLGKGGNVYIVV